ncbi:hypothetical protein SO802_009960 [Lithocarpus litseifolius]|uniref:Uncharacterized protein n=1 Tax=Lithocarpus litseifolius TaxID=425828 RepID=A0AAW2DFJ0_9ROSI
METFFEYMTRWKGKASRMVNRPNEEDQINLIIKNFLSAYNSRLLSSPISSFGELCYCGTRIEDTINNGQLDKGESKPPLKKTYGGEAAASKAPSPMNGILPKGITELKKRILEDNVTNITRSRKHYRPSFLEKDHPGRNMEEFSKLVEPIWKEEKEEEDRVLTQLKKTQAHMFV